jgi:hypothetical protein
VQEHDVDHFAAQPLARAFDRLLQVGDVEALAGAGALQVRADLGHDACRWIFRESRAQAALHRTLRIGVGRFEQPDAERARPIDDLVLLRFEHGPVAVAAEAPGAEGELGHGHAGLAERPVTHVPAYSRAAP